MWLSSLSKKQRQALIGLAHNVVVSDGVLDPNEEMMIDEFKREMALSPKLQPEYLSLEGMEEVFDNRRARIIAILNLLRLSYVDGAFEIEEECLLRDLSRRFDIDDGEFLLLDNWVKRMKTMEDEALAWM